MSNLSDFLTKPYPPKALYAGQPGSNGYWRRDIFSRPGTYTWTAKKAGKIKIQAIGTGSGASGPLPGASGAYGEKELTVAVGDVLTIVVGQGGTGVAANANSVAGGATSISGTPVGGTPLVLVGATAINSGNSLGTEGVATGPWGKSFSGVKSAATGCGSPSSASPFGPGKTHASSGQGGHGWGGISFGLGGASTHKNAVGQAGANGFLGLGGVTQGGAKDVNFSQSPDLWDMEQADSGGGAFGWFKTGTSDQYREGGDGGFGAGGGGPGSAGVTGGVSVAGGGTGYSPVDASKVKSGHGAGGGCSASTGGIGGDALIFLFWDEVAL